MAGTASNIAGYRIPARTGALPDVPLALTNLAADIEMTAIPKFSDTGARDVAYSGKTSAQKTGCVCWIINREGHSYWSPQDGAWKWLAVNRVLYEGNDGGTDVNGANGAIVHNPPGMTLPPGNRHIQISARAQAVQFTNLPLRDTFPRILIEASGYSGLSQTFCPGGPTFGDNFGVAVTFEHNDSFTASGVLDARMIIMNAGPAGGWMRFSKCQLTVIDRGPIG